MHQLSLQYCTNQTINTDTNAANNNTSALLSPFRRAPTASSWMSSAKGASRSRLSSHTARLSAPAHRAAPFCAHPLVRRTQGLGSIACAYVLGNGKTWMGRTGVCACVTRLCVPCVCVSVCLVCVVRWVRVHSRVWGVLQLKLASMMCRVSKSVNA